MKKNHQITNLILTEEHFQLLFLASLCVRDGRALAQNCGLLRTFPKCPARLDFSTLGTPRLLRSSTRCVHGGMGRCAIMISHSPLCS